MTFIPGYRSEDGRVTMSHRDGIEWIDAAVPRSWHRCKPQTCGYVDYFTYVERCACGAIRMSGRAWRNRNERRKAGHR